MYHQLPSNLQAKLREHDFIKEENLVKSVLNPLNDLPLLRSFLNKRTVFKRISSQNPFAGSHKLAATKDLYQRNSKLLRGFSSNLL